MRPCALIAMLALPALAGEFWNDKQPSQWSDKEVKRLLEKSPWAKEANVVLQGGGRGVDMTPPDLSTQRGPGGRGGMRGGGGMGGDEGGMGGGGGGRGGGGFGGGDIAPRAQPALPKITIRWASAAPIREASAKAEQPAASPELSSQYYVVMAIGFPMRGPAPGQPPSQEFLQKMAESLRAVTVLKRKGKEPVAPARVGMARGAGGPIMVFLFPRDARLAAEDKEVEFATRSGRMEIKSEFKLKDMLYRGTLEL